MNTNLKTLAMAAACLLLGVVIGRMLPADGVGEVQKANESVATWQTGEPRPPGDERSVPDRRTSSEPSGEVEAGDGKAETETAVVKPVGDEKMLWVPASVLETLSQAAGTRTSGQNLFSGDGKIEEILKITDQEKAKIQTAWKETQDKLREMEAGAMKSEVSEDKSVVTITVPDLTARTKEIGESLGNTIRNSLGESRSNVFLAVKQVDRMFTPEAGEQTYRIEPEEVGDGGWRYHITLEGPSGRRVWVSETIPDEVGHLTDVASMRHSDSEK